MASSNGTKKSLRLIDYSDRELLHLVRDHEDDEGYADTLQIAQTIWPKYADENPTHAVSSVAMRFAWMKRWGVMERHGKLARKWRLSDAGRGIVEGKLSAAQEKSVIGLADEKLMSLGYALSERYQQADDIPATLLRRAIQFGELRRRARV